MPLSLPKPLQGCYPDQRRRGIGSNRLVSWGAPSLCRQQRWCHTLVAGPIVSSLKILWRRGGRSCYHFGFESTSTLERSDGSPHSEQPPDRRTSVSSLSDPRFDHLFGCGV